MSHEAEIALIESELRAAGRAAHVSLDRELAAWDALSREVNVYENTIDDYTNDLCSRDYIATFSAKASPHLRADIEERVAASDERFRASTLPDDDRRIGKYFRVRPTDGWWWHRRPVAADWMTSWSDSSRVR